jgi:trans-2,3-dihydro-3-hydroxyanthranilate isomerase
MRAHRYLHYDVFTDRPLEGNQLAVFPDGRGLSAETMQAVAREMSFSETTFVLPAEQPGTDVRMRIFTPGAEMPMAGHPTIGSTFALAREGVIAPARSVFVFGLGVGPVEVGLEWSAGGELAFAWMTQLRPVFGGTCTDVAALAAALGLETPDLASTGLPGQEVSCGVPFLLVPVATRRAVDAIAVDLRALRALLAREHFDPDLPVFVFSLEPGADRATAYSRMFAPALGVHEDPATGAASGPLGSYLVRHQAVTPARAARIVSAQGVKMGRPSRITIAIDGDADDIRRVRIGGTAVLVGEGLLHL